MLVQQVVFRVIILLSFHVMYADDFVLLPPCGDGAEHNISFQLISDSQVEYLMIVISSEVEEHFFQVAPTVTNISSHYRQFNSADFFFYSFSLYLYSPPSLCVSPRPSFDTSQVLPPDICSPPTRVLRCACCLCGSTNHEPVMVLNQWE